MNDTPSKRKKVPSHYKRLGRELAMQFLFQCDMFGENTGGDFKLFREQAEASGAFPDNRVFRKACRYAEKLVSGIRDNLEAVDLTISGFSEKWDMKRMAVVDRNILRVAVYEMKFAPDIPPIVSIDEAVGIAKEFSSEKSGMFINGILNGVKDSLDRPPREAVDEL